MVIELAGKPLWQMMLPRNRWAEGVVPAGMDLIVRRGRQRAITLPIPAHEAPLRSDPSRLWERLGAFVAIR